jgi:hypothetical protein
MQHSSYLPHSQYAYTLHDMLAEQWSSDNPQAEGCLHSLPQGLVEFTDFGPMNNLPFDDLFVVSPGHSDVTGTSHFAFLDAYGARLVGDELEVLISNDENETEAEGYGFVTKEGNRVTTLTMHYESSAMGYGRGDSHALAPPLRIRAVTKQEIRNELEIFSREQTGCYCDMIVPTEVTYAIGLLYFPQYGHTLFNGLSNVLATLWRKNISYSDVELSVYLFRNTSTDVDGVPSQTYQLLWSDLFSELFSFFSSAVTQWAHLIDYAIIHHKKICFRRILVGALPHLDLMNISAPQELYRKYSYEIISNLFWQDLRKLNTSSPDKVTSDQLNMLSPDTYPNYFSTLTENVYDNSNSVTWKASVVTPYCAVTIVTRDVDNARSIINARDLMTLAVNKGCTAQVVSMERLTLKEQVGEVRWNTTLFVSVDGSALLNALFMQRCSTVYYVEMWRRAMMLPKFEPALWTGFTPLSEHTSFPDPSDPISQNLMTLISNYTAAGRAEELESLDLGFLPFPNRDIENFLRNKQSVRIPLDMFDRVLEKSIQHNKNCRLVRSEVSSLDATSSYIGRGTRLKFKLR